MEKKKTGKIIALVVAIVLVAAATTVGVMAATGVFKSNKAKAFELLNQAADKLSWSATGEYVGTSELNESWSEKGVSTNVQISNLQLDSSLELDDLELSKYTLGMDAQHDTKNTKTSAVISLAKGDSKLSMNYYVDSEKIAFTLPELINGKVFKMNLDDMKDSMAENEMPEVNPATLQKFEEDCLDFVKEELEKIHDEITCETLTGDKAGYKLTIPKATMDEVMNDLVTFMTGQEDMVNFINSYVAKMTYKLKEDGSAESTTEFDLMSTLKMAAATVSQYTQDFDFNVYGENGSLTGLETSAAIEEVPVTVSLEFDGEKNNSTVTLKAGVNYDGQDVGVTLTKKDTKADTCVSEFALDVTAAGLSIGTLKLTETINPSDNSYSLDGSLNAMGIEMGSLTANGSIKDMKQGSSVNYVLDDVSLTVDGIKYISFAMDVKMGVLENSSIEPPQGEEVEFKDSTSLEQYSEEIGENAIKIITDWGLLEYVLGSAMTGEGDDSLSLLS